MQNIYMYIYSFGSCVIQGSINFVSEIIIFTPKDWDIAYRVIGWRRGGGGRGPQTLRHCRDLVVGKSQ